MNDKLLRGVAFGVTTVAAAVVLAPSIAQVACPIARKGMKMAFMTFMRGREAMAGFVEMVEDAYAEATAELKQEADAMAAANNAATREPDISSGETGIAKKRKKQS